MRFSPFFTANTAIRHPFSGGAPAFLCAISLGLASLPATADLQTGRSPQGTLWISDQGLPSTVKPLAPEGIAVPSLSANTPGNTDARPTATAPLLDSSSTQSKGPIRQNPENGQNEATCNSIEQRYEGSRSELARFEQDKASGKILIPESGLIAMRQNLATLERLKALCR